nr:unnamed protein product [Digitaria exilis]
MGDTGDANLLELKQMMAELTTKVTTVEGDLSSLRVDQARLHVAVNNVQSANLPPHDSSSYGPKGKAVEGISSAAATHKLRFHEVVVVDGADVKPRPTHVMINVPKGHGETLEVPKDRAQRAEPILFMVYILLHVF